MVLNAALSDFAGQFPMIDLVIFDCDGVLVDSEIIAARVEAELLTAAGFEISPEEIAETYAFIVMLLGYFSSKWLKACEPEGKKEKH